MLAPYIWILPARQRVAGPRDVYPELFALMGVRQNDVADAYDHIVSIQTYLGSGARGHIQDEDGSYVVDVRIEPGNNMGRKDDCPLQ